MRLRKTVLLVASTALFVSLNANSCMAKTATVNTETLNLRNEAAKVMKWVDPSIELVACGSAAHDMPTYGSWEYQMLDECYENVDYVSLHRYYGNPTNDTPGFLARSMDLDDFIREVVAVCDAVGGKKHAKKKLNPAYLDEKTRERIMDQIKKIEL